VPANLIGYSWGAWLAFILASMYSELVKKLVLVGSGPFQVEYAKGIMTTRLSRLNTGDNKKVEQLMQKINSGNTDDRTLEEFGSLLAKADTYNPIRYEREVDGINMDIYQKVWPEAEKLRKNGKLLEYGRSIHCPIVIIHGDYDPHPFEGVKRPLQSISPNCEFVLLKKCGHKPWVEKQAKSLFYKTLNRILQ